MAQLTTRGGSVRLKTDDFGTTPIGRIGFWLLRHIHRSPAYWEARRRKLQSGIEFADGATYYFERRDDGVLRFELPRAANARLVMDYHAGRYVHVLVVLRDVGGGKLEVFALETEGWSVIASMWRFVRILESAVEQTDDYFDREFADARKRGHVHTIRVQEAS